MTDQECIDRVLSGNTRAFELLVNRYQSGATGVAMAVLRDQHLAKDAVQEGFLKAYLSLADFRGESGFATWLYRIVVRISLRRREKELKRMQRKGSLVGKQAVSANVGEDRLERQDRYSLIESVLGSLSTNEALVLRLHYLEELSVREVARVTDLSESNVKTLLHRGRKKAQQHVMVKNAQENLK
ncbi:RNA polymerase sigma factor [Lewinella sp. W8]|uniref:RNA polymerase sigma factor n=1 Tax=Lewinella sp. W8 TaxID=2528208 RepID=UPI001068BE7D|nr:sigma-70 family RNA polymerase sigma factor [Lewinella sp. W8]MTB49553.1 sigma-70 family RNA polymerase sigma factor [Lewinella sp. W8]